MKWETKNKINNINQLNKTRQKNKEIKNKPIEEIKGDLINIKYDYDKIINLYEYKLNTKLEDNQKKIAKQLLRDYTTKALPSYIGDAELLIYLMVECCSGAINKFSLEDNQI